MILFNYSGKILPDKVREELPCLTSMTVPHLAITPSANKFEDHSFNDAFLVAYGAVVYLKFLANDSTLSVRLLTAKTRI